ncbi:MAG: TldD/PmbA family protein, partial [Myxococcales bacterium]|nr:TldD/PmbA family protein [Myxococcales bacterium]
MPDSVVSSDAGRNDELMARSEQAVAVALKAGADNAWAWASRSRSVETVFRDQALEEVKESTSRSLSISLYVNGRFSRHSTTDLRPATLDGFIAEAVELTRALEVDPDRLITDPRLFEGRAEIELDRSDPDISRLTPEDRITLCQAMIERAGRHEKTISASASVSSGQSQVAGYSSNGFAGFSEGTSAWAGAEATLHDGDR